VKWVLPNGQTPDRLITRFLTLAAAWSGMSLLPSRGPDASASQDGELEVVGVDEDVSEIIDALSSDTARDILNTVYEHPGTPSDLADRLDMSIQKVSYHLEKLEDEELIAVAGTRYSEKGQEMKVYEPPEDPLVLFVGTRDRKSSLRSLVERLVPVVGVLTAASLIVQILMGGLPFVGQSGSDAAPQAEGGGDGGGSADVTVASEENMTRTAAETATATPTPDGDAIGAADATETATPTPTDGGISAADATATETATPTPQPTPTEAATSTPTEAAAQATDYAVRTTGAADPFQLSPGMAFFLGGLFVVGAFVAVWAYGEYA